MLNIIDINPNASNLQEVQRLKDEFRTLMEPTVKNGTVIIVSNFPPIGNMLSPIDYLILINIDYKDNNFLKIKVNGKFKFIRNAVFLSKSIVDDHVLTVEDDCLSMEGGEFPYIESLEQYCFDFRDYCQAIDSVWPFAVLEVKSTAANQFYNSRVLLNHPLTAKYIIWSMASQTEEKTPKYHVNSFSKDNSSLLSEMVMIRFARQLLEEANKRNKIGILTKNKIDQLLKSSKTIDTVMDNIGKSLSIITGKAGTGKTMALTKVIGRFQSQKHHVRFLTFNNLLVFDIKQLLRNFPRSDNTLSAMSIHSFFYRQAHTLGIPLLLSEARVKEVLQVCQTRIDKLRSTYHDFIAENGYKDPNRFLLMLSSLGFPKSDHEEFIMFSRFAHVESWREFDGLKADYLARKQNILSNSIGREIFLEDYYKVLELLYQAITDTKKFYEEQNISDRYELLSALYNTDEFIDMMMDTSDLKQKELSEQYIPFENLEKRIVIVKRQVNWSKLMVIDESQDFHLFEKEILFGLRKPENIVVASGGKEQLIRHGKLLDWSLSFNKKVPHKIIALRSRSYRQKENIVNFVNAFGVNYALPIRLESASESNGLGKIIIDLRAKTGFINAEIAHELKENGKINGCSEYEGLMFLIPSSGYTDRIRHEGFTIDENDVLRAAEQSSGRRFKHIEELASYGILSWDGVSENKSSLKVPFQTETRIIHYESCRGLEAWSCALMSLDSYFVRKRNADEASKHLADDLFLTEEERRDKYAALWCLMAFTRPMDTLYIQLDNESNAISKTILKIANNCGGVTVLR